MFAVRYCSCCRDWRNYPQLVLSARDEAGWLWLLATFWKVGIAASLYRCSTSKKVYQTKRKKKKLCFSQSTFFARPWRVSGLRLPGSLLWVFCDLFSGRSLGEFLWLFYCRRTFLPEGLESRNWGAYQECRRFRRRCGGSPAMGLVTARNMAYCTGTLLSRNYHTAVSFLSNDLRDRIRQILGLPSLVVTVLCCGSCANRFNCFVHATSLDLKPEVKKELWSK
jgi:hypothetical protein